MVASVSEFIRTDAPVFYGGALPKKTLDNIVAKTVVDPVTGCWLFTGALTNDGYAKCKKNGKIIRLHRWVCEKVHGPLGDKVPDHTCKRHNCINPEHLDPVTEAVNTIRGDGPTAANAKKTHCPKGHPYDAVRTGKGKRPYRQCTTCHNEWRRERRKNGSLSK